MDTQAAQPSTAIVKASAMPIVSMQDASQLANAFAQAHILGAENPAQGMATVVLIKEIGLVKANSRYQWMMGTLSKKTHGMLADFVLAGGTYRILRRDSECAEVVASFGLNKDLTFKFTWEDAKNEPFIYKGGPDAQIAELSKPFEKRNLKAKYKTPRSRMQMLWVRVVSDLCNCMAPECTDGMYPPEMVEDFDDRQAPRAAPVAIDPAEAARRVVAETVPPPPFDAPFANEPAEIDFSVCPAGFGEYSGKLWSEFDADTLRAAAAAEGMDSGLLPGHVAEIRKVLKLMEEGGAA
jgi:hypothetical protein